MDMTYGHNKKERVALKWQQTGDVVWYRMIGAGARGSRYALVEKKKSN